MFRVELAGSFVDWSQAEILSAEKAVTRGVHSGVMAIKQNWRQQVAAALGGRLGNAIRAETFPRGEPSARAAGIVYTKAPQIVGAHDRGDLIRAKDGFWLAVPLPAAGRRRISPGEWERRTGRRLRFVYRRGRTALLVDDGTVNRGARLMRRDGTHRAARGFRNRTIPVFALVPQVKLKKSLRLFEQANAIAATVPQRIVSAWR